MNQLTNYYRKKRSKNHLSLCNNEKRKQAYISNTSEPIKINKMELDDSKIVIDLCSDSEDTEPEDKPSNSHSSHSIFLHNPDQKLKGLNNSARTMSDCPTTPKKTMRSPSCNQVQSPKSILKFFSPTKNRRVVSPQKPKKNLSMFMISKSKPLLVEKSFPDDLKSYDDKTLFLLESIHKYLIDKNLKNLLPETMDDLLSKCMVVFKPGMRLVCRLYWRKKGWYRRDEIIKIASGDKNVMSDPDLELMISSLIDNGLIEVSATNNITDNSKGLTLDILFEILKVEELKEICKELKLKVKTKEDAKRSLENFSNASNITEYFNGPKKNNLSRLLTMLTKKAGRCYRLSEIAYNTLTRFFYLMNLGIDYAVIKEKKLELLFINKKANKETYPIDEDMILDNAAIVFNTKDEFESYFNACAMFESWEAAKTSDDKLGIIDIVYDAYKNISENELKYYKSLSLWLRRYTPAYEYVKVLENSVQELKKLKEPKYYSLALDILDKLLLQSSFRQHKKAEWYAEKALILNKHLHRDSEEAAKVLLEGLASNVPEETKLPIRIRATKMAMVRSSKISQELREELLTASGDYIREENFEAHHVQHKPMESYNNRGKIKFATYMGAGERIVQEAEEFCIDQYISSGQYTHGEHWEGKIVTTIFFLLFWDIIYTNIPGVRGIFLSLYQMYPLDLLTDSFYMNRKTLIDDRLQFIRSSRENELLNIMEKTWNSRPESELSGITRSLGWDKIAAVCTCLGAAATAAICQRLAMNYNYAHSGFPDLTLWNINTKQIKFVEVKTDSDKPSVKQLQWMQYLRDCGVPVEFCYVGVNTTRSKARSGPTGQINSTEFN
ncbi:fanconi-associated nuclease 1-like [Battus philenor]|uniref:fanconi-associated nuclease 1-like n=1 Tax=Battus philenor TaxID=42288 RepID=UPI0035D04D40